MQITGSTYYEIDFQTMCLALKGIGNILFISVLWILLIFKFLNFTAVFTKKLNFPKSAHNFPCKKVNFSVMHPSHIIIDSFLRTPLSSKVFLFISKSYSKNSKK